MAQYSVQQENLHGHARYVLRDIEANCEASILPSVGNNCISYKIPKDDDLLELIYSPPDPDTLKGRASGYGIPILYPWPNRIDSGKFSFDGVEYQLETPAPGEHASHGYVHERPWRVVDSGTSEGAWITSVFTSTDFPEIGAHFPFPFEAHVTYRLKDGILHLEFEGTNTGDSDMPIGLGIHPYFPLPLTEKGNRDLCTVRMPASTYWPLRDDPIPTGEILPVDSTVFDVRENTLLKDRYYDNVWSGVSTTDGWSRCKYTDPTEGVTIAMEANDIFRELVLYAPDTRPIVCFEPYTCVTNAFNLQNQGIDSGLIRLQPGEKLTGIMKIIGEVL